MKRMIRAAAAAAILFAPIALTPFGAQAQKPLTKATVALGGDGLQFSLQHLALGGGFYKEEGLDVGVVDVGSGPRQAAALMGGSSEFTSLGFIHVLKSISQGGTLVAIAPSLNLLDIQLVLGEDALKKTGITMAMPLDEKVKKLKGLKLAITTPGSTTDTWLRSLLKVRGLDADKDVVIQPVAGGTPMLAALSKKATEGFVWGAPQSHEAVQQGIGTIVVDPFAETIPEIVGVPYTVIITSRDTLKNKPEVLRSAVRALTKAMKFAREKPDEARAILQKDFPEIQPPILAKAWQDYAKAIPTTPVITAEQVAKTQAWLNLTQPKPINLSYETAFYPDFAKQAEADILGKK